LWWGALKFSRVVFASAGITWKLCDAHTTTLPSTTDNHLKSIDI